MRMFIRIACTKLVAYAALLGTLGLTACGPAAVRGESEPIRWRFAIEETQDSVQDRYARKFKELIEERSGGEIEVTVYPYGTLGTSDQVTELLRMGTVQFAMASPGHIGKLIPEAQVFLLHFIFSDDQEVNHRALANPELLGVMDGLYAEKGFKLLSIYQEGWMVWNTNELIRMPADFDGVKIRVMTSPMLLAAYRAYGASPTPLSYGEVYSALQLNMIDAQVNPVFAIEEMSFYEVTEYMIFGRHAPFITTAVTNKDFFENLDPERQRMVEETIAELDSYIFDVQREFNEKRLEIIKENKPSINVISNLEEEERAQFREASMPVRDLFVRKAGGKSKQVLELVLESVEQAESAHADSE